MFNKIYFSLILDHLTLKLIVTVFILLFFQLDKYFLSFLSEDINTEIKMARGLQKLQSQAKNNDKNNSKKSPHDNKKSAQAGLLFQCVVCKVFII